MKEPTRSTRIALFTLSGNTCAFPDCQAPMYEAGSIVGVVCHIHGQSVGGPRFDAELTDEELHGIDNLILLCPIHHKIIDDQPEKHDAALLRKIKAEHESSASRLPGDFLDRLVAALVDEVPDDWWERPGAPEFRLDLASNQTNPGAREFNFGLRQIDGSDIGRLRYRYRHGQSEGELKDADKRERRKWRLDPIIVRSGGEPFELELRFWWDGAERSTAQRWKAEEDLHRVVPEILYS